MTRAARTSKRALVQVAVLAAAGHLLLGCQSLPDRSTRDRLDPQTGVTITTAEDVLVFARTEGRYSRSARDYVYLGPVALNRQGRREYFLWVGVASTLDRGYLAPETGVPEALQLTLAGEPMEFHLQPWEQIAPGLSGSPSYRTPVEIRRELGARVTRDQLGLLERARPDSVRTADDRGATKLFEFWQGEVHWTALLALGD